MTDSSPPVGAGDAVAQDNVEQENVPAPAAQPAGGDAAVAVAEELNNLAIDANPTEDIAPLTAAVPRLDDLVVKCLAENYDIYPALDRIPPEYLDNVVALLDPSQIEFKTAAKYITTEKFWKRLCQERWPICQVANHGLSWKRMYVERHLQSLFEAYYPSKGGQNFSRLAAEVNAGRPFVHSITVQQLLSHLDLSEILLNFPNLSSLHLRYGARKLGMDYDKSLFGMQLRDAMSLSKLCQKTRFLTRLVLPENLLNNESVHILSAGLVVNETITHLDLSHNKIGDAGAKRLGKIIEYHPTLTHLDLGDNHIRADGCAFLSRALGTNWVLNTFSLKLNPIGDSGGADLLTKLTENSSLTKLNLSSTDLGEQATDALVELLNAQTGLVELDISCNDMNLKGQVVRDALAACQSLTTLDFRRCDVDEQTSKDIKGMLSTRFADAKQRRRKEYQQGWDEAL